MMLLIWLAVFALLYSIHKVVTRRTPLLLDKNSVIIITGACNGLGRATANILAQRYKCTLVVLDIMSHKFNELKQELEEKGSAVTCIKCDLSSEGSMNDAVVQIKNSFERIDVLINNAGILLTKAFDQQTYGDHAKTMAVNYLGPVFLTLNLKDRLRGHVVTIASVGSLMRCSYLSSYIASKHALYGLFNCIRTEQAGQQQSNISFSMVCPYVIDTGMIVGFQTRLNALVPILREADVAKIVAETVVNREEVVFVPFWMGALVKLASLLPDIYVDKFTNYVDTSNYGNPAIKGEGLKSSG